MRIPHAEQVLTDKQAELAVHKAKADRVRKLRSKLQKQKRADLLGQLFAQKVYWGRCLDDFADLFTQRGLTEQVA